MANPPEIIVYTQHSTANGAPAHMRYAAAMVSDGRPGTSWVCTAETPEAAREKLEKLWAKQFPATSKRGAHMRKTQAETVDDIGVIL